jgi:hypothetical protein
MNKYDNFPSELREHLSWVNVWNNSKIPMQTSQKKGASSTDPLTWGRYEEAVQNVLNGVYDGIGYVFHNMNVVGIDIDCGFDTDGFLSEVSIDIMRACRSYTERSRSGRGVHVLLKGKLPFKGKNNGNGVEIYESSRYFIVTGEKLIYDTMIENQDAIDYVIERYFPEIVKESETSGYSQRIYSPVYEKPENGKISLRPKYPPIPRGMRNLSLTSLAGQMHNQGYSKKEIYQELLYANKVACSPSLPEYEIQTITNSVTRYRR